MNAHLPGKTFLALLLIFSLCADIAMPAYAGENSSQNKQSENAQTAISSVNETSADDSSDTGSPNGDSQTDSSGNPDSSDGSDSDKTSPDGNSSGIDTSADQPSDENISDSNPSGNTVSGSSSPDEDSSGSTSDNTATENLPADEMENLPESKKEETAEPLSAETETTFITLSAAGDCTLGIDSRYSHNFNKYYRKKGDSYFFKKVKPIFSQDDITIVNFEGTLTTNKKRARKTFTFKGPKKYASILKKGSVEVVNLANNHSKDYGKSSLTHTQNTMRKNNIGYCRNTVIHYQTVNDVKMAFLGFSALEKVTKNHIKTGIAQAKENNAEIIIVSFHWGVERKYYPNAKQKSLGHYAIDCGASLVLGHHPHVLQGIESYNGRYIVYSLGNFCFGGNSNPKDKDTMIFQQTFSVKGGKLQPENNAKIIPCSLSSRKKTNDFQPRVLSGKEKKRLIKKMNKLSRNLKVSIDSDGKLN